MTTTQIIHGGNAADALPTADTTVEYNIVMGSNVAWNATETNVQELIPTNGLMGNLRVHVTVAPGAGDSWTFCLVKNGNPDTATNCVVSGANTLASADTSTLDLAPGDTVSVRVTTSGTCEASSYATYWVTWVPDIDDENIYIGGSTDVLSNANVAEYNTFYGPVAAWTSSGYGAIPTALAGTWKKYYVWLSNSPGAGGDYYEFAVYDSGSNVAPLVRFTNAESGLKSNVVDTRATTAADYVAINYISSGSPVNTPYALWGIVFVPTVSSSGSRCLAA